MSKHFASAARVTSTHPVADGKKSCVQGHKYTEANTYWHRNWKGYWCMGCRECGRLRLERKREDPEFKARGVAASAKWRENNPAKYKALYEKAQAEKNQIIADARMGGCSRCSEKDTACLDFHHRNGMKDKLGHIGEMRRFAPKRLRAEIAKCDVLCANCHRKHHRDERQTKSASAA